MWGLLLFLTLGLSEAASEGSFPWVFLLLGCGAFVATAVTWIGTWRSSSRFPAAVGLAVVAGGLVSAWFPLARVAVPVRIADLSAGTLSVGLVVSGVLILPCLGRIVTPSAPLSGALRMGLFALGGFAASVVAIQFGWLEPDPALLGSVVVTTGLAGFGGLRGVRPEDRHAWFAVNAGGVALVQLTLLLVRATLILSGTV